MDQQNRTVWTAERLIEILRKLAEEQVLPKHLVDASVSGLDTVETLGMDSIGIDAGDGSRWCAGGGRRCRVCRRRVARITPGGGGSWRGVA